MSAAGYRVIAAVAPAADRNGFIRAYYTDAVIPWLSDAQREHFLSHGLVVEVSADEAAAALIGEAADPDGSGDPASTKAPTKPAKTASDEAWIAYGVAQGQDAEELGKLSKAELRELLG